MQIRSIITQPTLASSAGAYGEVDRVDAILDAFESRLGINTQADAAAVQGDPRALLDSLPSITIQIKDKAGKVTDEATMDVRAWVREQLK